MLKSYESSIYHPKLPLVAIAIMALMVLMICFAMFSTAPEESPEAGYPAMHRPTQPADVGVLREALRNAM